MKTSGPRFYKRLCILSNQQTFYCVFSVSHVTCQKWGAEPVTLFLVLAPQTNSHAPVLYFTMTDIIVIVQFLKIKILCVGINLSSTSNFDVLGTADLENLLVWSFFHSLTDYLTDWSRSNRIFFSLSILTQCKTKQVTQKTGWPTINVCRHDHAWDLCWAACALESACLCTFPRTLFLGTTAESISRLLTLMQVRKCIIGMNQHFSILIPVPIPGLEMLDIDWCYTAV